MLNGYRTRRPAKREAQDQTLKAGTWTLTLDQCLEALASTVPSTHVVITPESLLGLESGETARIPSCPRRGHSGEGVPLSASSTLP